MFRNFDCGPEVVAVSFSAEVVSSSFDCVLPGPTSSVQLVGSAQFLCLETSLCTMQRRRTRHGRFISAGLFSLLASSRPAAATPPLEDEHGKSVLGRVPARRHVSVPPQCHLARQSTRSPPKKPKRTSAALHFLASTSGGAGLTKCRRCTPKCAPRPSQRNK